MDRSACLVEPCTCACCTKCCHLTAAQSRSRHQSREHRIQRHMSNLAADMAFSGQCDFVLEIPWNCRAVRFGGCIHDRLKGFHCAWVLACAWGYAEGGWRVVTSMRSVADLLVSRSCNETHWHRSVEGMFPPAASLSHLCRRLMPIVLRRPAPMELAELVAGATIKRRLRSKQTIQRRLTKNSHCLVTVCLNHQQQRQSQTWRSIRLCQTGQNRQKWKSIRLCRKERNQGVHRLRRKRMRGTHSLLKSEKFATPWSTGCIENLGIQTSGAWWTVCVKIVLIQQCWRPPNSCTARLARRVSECYLVL